MDRFIRFVLHQRLLVIIGAIALFIAGILAWTHLPIDAFPDVTNVQVMVLTEAPGLAPVDVEQQVTFPIELSLQGLPGVKMVRSLSKAALSQVIIVFDDKVDTYFARQLVFERLQTAKENLPKWAEPEMGPTSTGLGEVYQYTLESDRHTQMELRTIQDWIVAPQLRTIAGVTEVNSFGGYVKQYHVLIRPDRLLQYKISLNDVLASLENNNANAGGNFITRGWEQSSVRSVGLIKTKEDIENITVKARDGTPVFIKDIAEVKTGPETRQGAVTRDAKGEAVAGMVIMLKDANSKIVVENVKKTIPKIQEGLPEGVRINPFYDRTSLIQDCIGTIRDALWQGGLFVIVILFLFLGNLRTSLIVALTLPLAACFTFILMGSKGVSANLMSLGGLAIALGMIVDASIVIGENITRHIAGKHDSQLTTVQIAFGAVKEVAKPIIFAILIIVVVFFPLFTLEGHEGKMFKPLALTICFAMAGSLLISLTVVPVLCTLFLKGRQTHRDFTFVRILISSYLRLLKFVLHRRKITLVLAGTVLFGSLLLIPFLGSEFLPQLDEGAIAINVVRLPSASLEGSVAVGQEIERRFMAKFPEVSAVVTKTGRAEISEDPMGPEQNDVIIMLHPKKTWKSGRDKKTLVAEMQKELNAIPGIRPSFSQPIALRVNELLSGIKSDLAVKIFGPDLELLRKNANLIAEKVKVIPGAQDLKVEQVSGFAQIEIVIDRSAIARYKINVSDINDVVETAIGGKVVTTIVEEQMRFAVLARFPEEYRRDIAQLKNILIPSPEGPNVPLGELATISETEAPAQISREDGSRRIVVECNVRGRDIGSFVTEMQREIKPIVKTLPPGYFVKYGGQFENQQRAMKRLSIVVPLSILLIFIMLFSALGRVSSALLVLINLPFALIGGILAMSMLRIPLSVSAVIGFIALFGTAVSNGTVLVTFFDQLRKEGMSVFDAVLRGCELRFRPLLMTALTAMIGVTPLIYSTGSGSEIQRPLATVVLGGMISSMLLTLVVLPVIYLVIFRKSEGKSQPESEYDAVKDDSLPEG
ncbi:MAG: CusA/CzcA family heavy metal efflux RND transporter [Candidatus Latescibacterota bacterium]